MLAPPIHPHTTKMASGMALPASLKPIQTILGVSKQFAKRDPVIFYYCRMYAIQQGIKLGKGDDSAKGFLVMMMDELQTFKRQIDPAVQEALDNEIVGCAHIENVALKLFQKADEADREGHFDQALVKKFYVASQLFVIMDQFGEQTEEIESKKKYSKWKSVDIDRCLKNGITPTPGPAGSFLDDDDDDDPTQLGQPIQPPPHGYGFIPGATPPFAGAQPVYPGQDLKPTPLPRKNNSSMQPPPYTVPPPTTSPSVFPSTTPTVPSGGGVVTLSGVQKDQVQKYCKYAISSMDFNDTPGAIDFLEKSLRLLRTGKED